MSQMDTSIDRLAPLLANRPMPPGLVERTLMQLGAEVTIVEVPVNVPARARSRRPAVLALAATVLALAATAVVITRPQTVDVHSPRPGRYVYAISGTYDDGTGRQIPVPPNARMVETVSTLGNGRFRTETVIDAPRHRSAIVERRSEGSWTIESYETDIGGVPVTFRCELNRPIRAFDLPLSPGRSVRDESRGTTIAPAGKISLPCRMAITTHVEGSERIRTRGKTWSALRIEQRVDISVIGAANTTSRRRYWFAPSLGAVVRFESDEQTGVLIDHPR